MNVTITGRHMDVTGALKAHVESGLSKIESHFDRVIDATVVLQIQKTHQIVEVNLHANGLRIHGRESSDDMYRSIDAVMDKLERQIQKHKTRIHRHKPRPFETPDYEHVILQAEPGNGKDAEAGAVVTHREIHRETLAMKPLSADEAVMQLELVDDPFLVFMNADSMRVNVLYRHHDGGYGLIEPQF